jgi:DNA helicase-2/ATP-dependent DNA helicase PcrA
MIAPVMQKLNPQQQAAVEHRSGHLRIIAGAGTGKTATLAHRCARLIEDGVLPFQIMFCAFTNAAADNLRRRVGTLIKDGDLITGGTMHSLASRILHRHGHLIGLQEFTVIDRADAESLLTHLRKELGLDIPPTVKSRQLAELISYEANTYQPLQVALASHQVLHSHAGAVLCLQEAFLHYKRDAGLYDYDDLLYGLLELLEGHAREVVGHIKHIMVDEAQDLNALQLQVLHALLASGACLTAVGDPCQAIYGWRGALPSVMEEMFKGLHHSTLSLSLNYRSAQSVLDYANRLIGSCPDVPHNPLQAAKSVQGHVDMQVYPSESQEARAVALAIRRLLDSGISADDIVVQYSSSTHGIRLQCELATLGVSYITKGGLRITDTAYVRDMLALLRLSYNSNDGLSFRRVLALIPGIGAAKARQIAAEGLGSTAVPPKAVSRVESLAACLEAMRSAQPVDAWAAAMLWYDPLISQPHHRTELEQTGEACAKSRSVKAWIEDMVLDKGAVENGKGKVCLSTIHSSKGEEFAYVWLMGVSEGRLAKTPESIRLLYVACTRSEHHLCITSPLFCNIRNQYRYTTPSTLLPPVH